MYKTVLQHLPVPHRLSLIGAPTPIQKSHLAWDNISLYWKRDDLTPYGLGGNKLRKLEFLMANALENKSDLIITTGGPQSNHARLTAVVAAMFQIPSLLLIPGTTPEVWEGNLLLDRLAGAEVIACGEEPLPQALERITAEKRIAGYNPYPVPLGGSNPLGALGYFLAFFELLEQTQEQGFVPDKIVCPVGSAGTLAGMLAANSLLPQPLSLLGVSVWQPVSVLYPMVTDLAEGVLRLLGVPGHLPEFTLTDEFIGAGYGDPTPQALSIIPESLQTDGILVDPVYTAKGLTAIKQLAHTNSWQGQHIVYWHTGGSPAIFAERYSSALLQAL